MLSPEFAKIMREMALVKSAPIDPGVKSRMLGALEVALNALVARDEPQGKEGPVQGPQGPGKAPSSK